MPILTSSFLDAISASISVGTLGAASHTLASLLFAILGIGFLICFHEMGHFFACRLTKTRVETFSIGFGPRLFGWESRGGVRRFTVGARQSPASEGTMDFRISIVPLGGYVKMAGENPGEQKTGSSDEYPSKPFLSRVFIISAGVMMNAIAAIGCFAVAYFVGLKEVPPVVGAVTEGGPAWRAGLEPGDRVKALDGDPVRSFDELRNAIVYLRRDQDVTLDVERGGKPLSIVVKAEYDTELGAPQMKVVPGHIWTSDDGRGRLVVGPEDRVTVAGRFAYGGYAAAALAEAAVLEGMKSVTVVFLDKPGTPPRELDLSQPRKKSEGEPLYRLGVRNRSTTVIDSVRPKSPAEAAGLRAGDEIVGIDGHSFDTKARVGFLDAIGSLSVRRPEGLVEIHAGAVGPLAIDAFLSGIQYRAPDSVIVDLASQDIEGGKSPAEEAGVKPGDRILAIADEQVSSWKDLLAEVKNLTGKPVSLRVQTGTEAPRELQVTPRASLPLDPLLFDVQMPKMAVPVSGAFDAMGLGAARTVREIKNIFRTIRSLVLRDVSAEKNLGGPGTLVKIASESLADSWGMFLLFIAIISVNLAVLNILPIPVLDGGHLLFLVIEKIKGSPVKESTIAKAQLVGMVLLLGLMVFAVRNDVRLWNK